MGPEVALYRRSPRALDASLRESRTRRARLGELIGDERVQELGADLRREFEPVDIEEIRPRWISTIAD